VTPHLDPIKGSSPAAWTTPSAGTLVALNPVMEGLCRAMEENKGRIIAMEHLVARAVAKTGETARVAIRKLLADIGPKLVWSGALAPSAIPSPCASTPSKTPKAFAVARIAATNSTVIPNSRHQNVSVTDAERAVLSHCDGTKDSAAIAKLLGGKARADDVRMCLQTLSVKGLFLNSPDMSH